MRVWLVVPPRTSGDIARPVDGNIPLDGVATCDIGAFEFRPQKIAVTPAHAIDFGTVTDGTISDQVITINNLGDGSLNITDIAGLDPLAAPFSLIVGANTCTGATLPHPLTLFPSSCTVTVRFAPTAARCGVRYLQYPEQRPG